MTKRRAPKSSTRRDAPSSSKLVEEDESAPTGACSTCLGMIATQSIVLPEKRP